MKKRLLALDIGGSKTRIQILDTDGNILSEICGVGVASAVEDTSALPLLDELLSKIPDKEEIAAAAINLGGRNTEQVKNTVLSHFPNIPIRIFRESEGTAAYALGAEYNAPVILMAGTGAIAVGSSNGNFVTTGGWGINIGDEGSGYDIGLKAIRLTLQALDGTDPLSPLSQYISECDTPLGATDDPATYRDNRDKVREKLFPLDRQHIASFTKIVAEFAEREDKLALKIFEQAGENLAEIVSKTFKKLENAESTVVITGGLVHAKKFWAPYFEKHLSGMRIHYVTDGLLLGTRRIAKELYNTGDKKQ